MLSTAQKAEADNTYLDLDYLGHQIYSNNYFFIDCFEEGNDK